MKIFKHIIPALLLLIVPACQRMESPSAIKLVEHKLYASLPGENAPEIRTVLHPDYDRKVLWSPHEYITILSSGGNYRFQGDNETASASASFSGTGPEELGNYVALYPYNASASYSGGYVSTTLPTAQTGRPGSFDDGYLIMADDATGSVITFNHVCSGLRFQVSQGNIEVVTLRGNSNEKIAGDFRFRFASENTPEAEAGSAASITLTPPGDYFEPGKYYYIVTLPTIFSNGLTLTAIKGDQVGELRFSTSVTFSRGAFKNITGNLDSRMSWSTSDSQVYYGEQNTFCVRPGQSFSFDVSPRKVYGTWQRSGLPATADSPDGTQILWGSGAISSASLSGNQLTVTASGTPGSGLVAIKKGSTILWSYLIWVTSSAPEEFTLPDGGRLLPPLGGNLYFQWGRKDPLQASASRVANQGTDGLPYSIANPCIYIRGMSNAFDWLCTNQSAQDGTLWGDGGAKTVWDPCPEGYRVPSEADFSSLDINYLQNCFDELGYVSDDGWHSQGRTYWTRTVNGYSSTALDDDYYNHPTTVIYDQSRSVASPVRCIKE